MQASISSYTKYYLCDVAGEMGLTYVHMKFKYIVVNFKSEVKI